MDMAETAGRNGKQSIDEKFTTLPVHRLNKEVLEYERSSYLGKD